MRVAFALSLFLLACGGGTSGPALGTGTLSGSVRGQTFTPRDATAALVSVDPAGVPGKTALIALSSSAGLCGFVSAGKQPKSTQYLVLTAFQIQPDYSPAPPPAPGVYSVGSLSIENGGALFSAVDGSCSVVGGQTTTATTGTITLTSVGSRYAGSYDLTFEFGDHVTGTFDAPVCAGVGSLTPGSVTLACQ